MHEPSITPRRTAVIWLAACAPLKASAPINKLMVKPTPATVATPNTPSQVLTCGLRASLQYTAMRQLVQMQIGLAMHNPSAIPSGIGCHSCHRCMPANDIPALAKANTGRIINATQGCRRCSSCLRGEFCGFVLSCNGIISAKIIPAKVACTPDFNTQIHNRLPTMKYGARAQTLQRFKINNSTISSAAASSMLMAICRV